MNSRISASVFNESLADLVLSELKQKALAAIDVAYRRGRDQLRSRHRRALRRCRTASEIARAGAIASALATPDASLRAYRLARIEQIHAEADNAQQAHYVRLRTQIETEFASSPDLKADLLDELSWVYSR